MFTLAGPPDRMIADGLALGDLSGGDAVRDDLGVHVQLADPAGDQLGVLGPEVDDEHRVVVGVVVVMLRLLKGVMVDRRVVRPPPVRADARRGRRSSPRLTSAAASRRRPPPTTTTTAPDETAPDEVNEFLPEERGLGDCISRSTPGMWQRGAGRMASDPGLHRDDRWPAIIFGRVVGHHRRGPCRPPVGRRTDE